MSLPYYKAWMRMLGACKCDGGPPSPFSLSLLARRMTALDSISRRSA
jgi:hypothetical protein